MAVRIRASCAVPGFIQPTLGVRSRGMSTFTPCSTIINTRSKPNSHQTAFRIRARPSTIVLSSNDNGGDKELLTESQQSILAAVSLPCMLVVAYSEFVLGTTGCGLPPGPAGLYGAVEGISYLVLVALVGLSVYVKVKTGKGLPQGPYALLGAAEGLAYLLIVFGIADAAYVLNVYGSLPSAVPVEGSRCYVPLS